MFHDCVITVGCLLDLLQVSLAAKTREGIKERETCNTWQHGSLAGQDSVQSASFTKNQYPIICLERTMKQQSEALRYFFDNGRLKLR